MCVNIENRMKEFEKVSDTTHKSSSIDDRMEEFQKNTDATQTSSNNKETGLPFGLKPHKPCTYCSGTMLLEEVKQTEAIYTCSSCNKSLSLPIRG